MSKNPKMYNFQNKFLKIISAMMVAVLILFGCQENMPTEPLEAAFEVHGRDNGNEGDASDIEVNYSQFGLDQIKNYRAFVVKSSNEAIHDLNYLQGLGETQYLDLAPNEVIPSRGKRLPASMLDSDGDVVITGIAYRVAVISLPLDAETYLPALAYSKEDIILGANKVVCDFTDQLDIGAGQLAIDAQGTLLMASYDFISDLSPVDEFYSNVVSISTVGKTTKSIDLYRHLGGASSDSEGNFYISNTSEGEILKYTAEEPLGVLEHQGIKLNQPTGIFVDKQGIIFVADRQSGSIYRIDKAGISSDFASVEEDVLGLTGDNEGNLYASINTEEGKIVKISSTGQVETLAQIPTFVKANYLPPFVSWLGHLEYHKGVLYVAGTSTHRIYNVTLDGEVSVFAGSGDRQLPHGDILTADFNRPMGLTFSLDGKTLYISGCEDTVPSHVQAVSPSRVYKIELVD